MESLLKLVTKVINGIPFASYDFDTQIYRAETIKQRQSVVIPGLKAGMVQVVDLKDFLDFNLLVTGVDMDLSEDDEQYLESDGKTYERGIYGYLYVNVINRKTDDVIKKLIFPISPYPYLNNEIILTPDHIYEFKPSRDVNMITFTGEPVHLREPLVFIDGKYKEKLTPRKGRG